MNTLQRRKFTDDEKRKIVDEALIRGINVILHEHRLSYSVFSRWRKKFQPDETRQKSKDVKILQQLKEVLTENERLKKIIANQALEIQVKTEKLSRI